MTQRLMLLDSASLYFRAFYGVPDQRRSPDEPQTNAVRGFLDMIATLVSTHRPTHLVACWDNDWRPAFRVNAIPTYKTHRLTEGSTVQEESPENLTPQVPLIVDTLQALGIARIGSDGYEADDVIGTLTHRARGRQLVDVVTGDRDLFQLVDDDAGVRVLYTARGGVRDPDVVTQMFLQSKYLVPTGQAYADMATLRGDASDGLPGVAGIGEKTAATLINRYGDLAGLRRALAAGDPQIKGAQRTRLEAASAYLDVAPTVVQV
ncbi:MAG: 5'-3' exonuclease, partial [Dermatophilaceae bacterium]